MGRPIRRPANRINRLCWLVVAATFTPVGETPLFGTELAKRIDLEIVVGRSPDPTSSHRWLEILKKLPFSSVRIRTGLTKKKPTLTISDDRSRYHVTGVLVSSDRLELPGGAFSSRDGKRLLAWIDGLSSAPANGNEEQYAFGLTAQQLVGLHDAFKSAVADETKGKDTAGVVDSIVDRLSVRVVQNAHARGALAENHPVLDELKGVSSGTALAALLRPLGLVCVPQARNGRLDHLLITDFRSSIEAWPIGWPRKKKLGELTTKLFDKLDVEIDNVPLDQTLAALQERLSIAFIVDQNGMARQQIDLSRSRISFPNSRTFYKRVLDRVLRQAKLSAEIRIDENGQPFVWITPINER